jgi:molybdopterin synthase catalytic subunit
LCINHLVAVLRVVKRFDGGPVVVGDTYKANGHHRGDMKVLGVVGPSGAGKTTLVERLVERLPAEAGVATVKHLTHGPELDREGTDTFRHRAAGADVTYGVADGEWFASGDDRSLTDTLDDLARKYDYAFLEGFSGAPVAKVALGGRETTGDIVERAPRADDVDIDALVDTLDGMEEYESLGSLVAKAKRSPRADRAGAIATFTGRVRAKDGPDDDPTRYLEFEKYEGVAGERMATIAEELEAREGVERVLLHHRTGRIDDGEDIVFVVVLAGHRGEAFQTVKDGIDRLKEEVPIFKREVTVEEEFWVHDRE